MKQGVRRGGVRLVVFAVLVGLAAVGCAAGRAGTAEAGTAAAVGDAAGSEYGAESAESAVARFLEGVRGGDYPAMARVFGTASGPAERRWGRGETEQRMFILAGVLAHRSHRLRPLPVAASGGTARWVAELEGTRRGAVSVPFVLAAHEGRWFVERILTDVLSGS